MTLCNARCEVSMTICWRTHAFALEVQPPFLGGLVYEAPFFMVQVIILKESPFLKMVATTSRVCYWEV